MTKNRKLPVGYYIEKRVDSPRYMLYRSVPIRGSELTPVGAVRTREFVTVTYTLWGARRVAREHSRLIEQYGQVPARVESGGP